MAITRRPLTRSEIIRRIEASESTLRRFDVKRIGLFGSFADNRQRKGSDVDLLVEFTHPTFDNFMALSAFLERLFKRKVDLLTPEGLSPYMRPAVEKAVQWQEVR
jgi:uncharacterized protein